MENSIKISALAITLNEAHNIEAYINSLWFADEILIVDSYSTDDTIKLASKHSKVKVFHRPFDNFSDQKNFAIAQAKNDWVTFFDPDAIAYFVKRDYFFMGKLLRYSGIQNDYIIRVFNKNFCRYNSNLVHELLIADGKTERLKKHLPHHTYKSLDDYTDKLHHYSRLQAKMLYAKGVKPNLYHFLFRPWYRFCNQFFLRLGILDGKEGFVLAYVHAFSVFKRYVNLWTFYRKIK